MLGLLHQDLFGVFLVEEGKKHYGESCEEDVINLENPFLIENLP
jgi:hypothetical protein